ncbi:MAG TPA: helix-turn-helix transcriptional regulator [Longimicrobiales bacterium]|nr:helix-turn-helix transcriptional regulator [Longimicrobiales bacterium]
MPDEPTDLQALVRTMNEVLILACLRSGRKHGYQIALDVERDTGGVFAFQHGTLYPILHRLEKRGLIAGAWDDAGGRKRKVYGLTPAGRAHMATEGRRCGVVFEAFRAMLERVP